MGFDSSKLSFARYAVIGQAPKTFDEGHLERLRQHAFTDHGIPSTVEYGWAGPGHLFDGEFSFERCVFNDCLHFAMRLDTNRVPGDVRRAYMAQEEKVVSASNPSGFMSKVQKRAAKEKVLIKLENDVRAGKYRRSKLYTLLWDPTRHILYAPAGTSLREKLCELFSRTFGLELQMLTSGRLAERACEGAGNFREFEDWTPTRFARNQVDPDAIPTYPWSAKGNGAKDFIGNEFLMWLWFKAANGDGTNDISVLFDRSLVMDCCYAESGKTGLTSYGPTRMPEAMDAVRSGKVPRKAGLIINGGGDQFSFTLGGETMAVSGLKLPNIDDADTLRVLFEERITKLRNFDEQLNRLFNEFLIRRTEGWTGTTQRIRNWIAKSSV